MSDSGESSRGIEGATGSSHGYSGYGGTGAPGPITNAILGGGGAPAIVTTAPDILLRHNISDEELSLLGGTRSAGLYEGAWACVGIFAGSVLPAGEALQKAYWATPPQPLGVLQLLTITLAVGAVVASCLLFYVEKRQGSDATRLESIIRGRTRR